MSAPHFQFFAATYLIAMQDEGVLLARRHNTGWMDGWYTLPAGHVDGGETVHEAMA
jgi:8-oxo-dGTP pyrophosphatase MutT (NUDIX family)